jgi:hypothetical protein
MIKRIEELTPDDRVKIKKKIRKDNMSIFAVLIVVVFASYEFVMRGLSEEIKNENRTLFIAFIVVLGAVSFFVLFFRDRVTVKDLDKNEKEIYVGHIEKKLPKHIKKPIAELGYKFYIDDKSFRVTKQVYNQYEDNDIVHIEVSPRSRYLLNVFPANEKEKEEIEPIPTNPV